MRPISDTAHPLSAEPHLALDSAASVQLFDVITGEDDVDDILDGTAGPDKISGLGGDDVLGGEEGYDTLIGGWAPTSSTSTRPRTPPWPGRTRSSIWARRT